MKITDIFPYWKKIEASVFGRWVFNRLIFFINPYTAALRANIIEMRKGYVRMELNDRRGIRNHLNSIHAIALTNMGEFTSGMAVLSLLSDNMRGIPIQIKINFLKKARGKLTSECTTQLPLFNEKIEHTVTAIIKDSEGDEVANVIVVWKLGYKTD